MAERVVWREDLPQWKSKPQESRSETWHLADEHATSTLCGLNTEPLLSVESYDPEAELLCAMCRWLSSRSIDPT